MNFRDETPTNIAELVRQANDKLSYRNRLDAVEELGKWRCRQSKDVLWRLMINDKVYQVQETAFRKLQAFGESVKLPRKKKGHLTEDINKKLLRVRDVLGAEYSPEEFRQKFKELYPEACDVYEFEKGDRFDQWVQNVLSSAPKKK